MGVNFSHSSHKTPEKPLKGIWAYEVYSLGGDTVYHGGEGVVAGD